MTTRSRMLAPAVLAVLEDWERRHHPDSWESSPEQARLILREFTSTYAGDAPLLGVEDVTIPGVADRPARLYIPHRKDDAVGAILYLHGGGWVLGDLDTHDTICRHLAEETGAIVLSPHYRLAPEHPFPAALEDAYDALCWLVDTDSPVSAASRVAVAGDSAGANLAVAVTMLSARRGGPVVDDQILFYPVTEKGFSATSFQLFGEGYFLSAASMRWFWDQYKPAPSSGELADLAAVAAAPSFRGLPRSLIVSAECDPLRDQSEAFAGRMARDGVPVTLVRVMGMCHGFLSMSRDVPQSLETIALAGSFLTARDAQGSD